MHLKKLDNYMSFMEDVSDSFVQMDVKTMISSNKFSMTEPILGELKKEISYYINSFECINSETFVGYESLPKLSYEWNKYLLMGVVRTYLSGLFIAKTAGTNYRNLSYIVDIK